MTHADAVARAVADDYVAGRLSPDDRAAFEAHFFECDECFAALQAEDLFGRTVRQLAAGGSLGAGRAPRWSAAAITPWLLAAAAIVAAVATATLTDRRTTRLESRLARAETRSADLERALTDARRRADAAEGARAPEANVPLAILHTTRGTGVIEIAVPADAARFIVWFEDLPETLTRPIDLTLRSTAGAAIHEVHGLRRNQYGAVVASFPAAGLAPDRYILTVTTPGTAAAVATYTLAITR